MTEIHRHRPRAWVSYLVLSTLVGCASSPNQAPVENRGTSAHGPSRGASAGKSTAAAAPAEAKPGTYIVKPGDTLMRVGLETGQSWRDIARWNNIDNANVIEVGQVLRVVPPGANDVASKAVAPTRVETRPLDPHAASAAAGASAGAASNPAVAAASAAGSSPAPAHAADEGIQWAWPAAGPVIGSFDEARTKGLDIGGKAGDPVWVAADGRVVYAGFLRGYGNLVIVKHNDTFLTAYGHNQTLLVKEDQAVRKGQKIAEMGSTDSDKVELHFEIRRQGKPIDPAKLLPAR